MKFNWQPRQCVLKDSVRFYILGKKWKRKVETLGKDMGLDFTGELII